MSSRENNDREGIGPMDLDSFRENHPVLFFVVYFAGIALVVMILWIILPEIAEKVSRGLDRGLDKLFRGSSVKQLAVSLGFIAILIWFLNGMRRRK